MLSVEVVNVKYSVTQLRQDIYRIIDQVIETGIQVEIERKGRILRITPENPALKTDRLKSHDTVIGNPEDIADITWEDEWNSEADS